VEFTDAMATDFWLQFHAGVDLESIAGAVGVAVSTLRKWMRAQGLPDGAKALRQARRNARA
jgi:transposase-like protein